MSPTWHSDTPPPAPEPLSPMGWLRVGLRGGPLLLILALGLGLMLLLRLLERPIWGLRRPLTPWITVGVCRAALWLLGIRWQRQGSLAPQAGLMVANHASWLDIFALNAVGPLYFVSKAEVANWPGIGLLARATGTLFIARDRRRSAEQADALQARLAAGHRLLLFPEGTSSDGRRLLPFRAAMLGSAVQEGAQVQPLAVIYHAPAAQDPRFYGWWGDMELGPHLLQILAARPQGRVEIRLLPPLCAAQIGERKALTAALERQVRQELEAGLAQ